MCGIDKTESAKFAKYCENYIKNFELKDEPREPKSVTNDKLKIPTKEQIKKLQVKGLNLVKQIKKNKVKQFKCAYSIEWNKVNKKFANNPDLRSYNYAKARIAVAKKFI